MKLPCYVHRFSSILYLDTFSVHLSVKSQVTIVKYKDISSVWSWTHFQCIILLNLMSTMLSTQIFVQSYTWILFHSLFLLNLMFSMLRSKISYKYHIYAQCSLYEIPINRILYLKYHVKYTGLVQSYTWNYFHSIFLLNLMFTMLSTQISYKYHIYAQCIL